MGLAEIIALKEAAKLPKEKKRYTIPRKSKKKLASEKADKEELKGGDSELEIWFKERRKSMVGICSHCGGRSCKDSDQYYKFSICHILPKALFPSVATHEYNFIELCFWTNNCHGNMDNNILDLIDMNCWDEIVTKFCIMYPSIAPTERRKIPQVLLNYIEVEK
jgi:hypothetical protein